MRLDPGERARIKGRAVFAGFWCNLLARPSGGFEGGVMARFLGLDELFEGRHFDREIIVLCVRWYLRFKLSFRDLVVSSGENPRINGVRSFTPPHRRPQTGRL